MLVYVIYLNILGHINQKNTCYAIITLLLRRLNTDSLTNVIIKLWFYMSIPIIECSFIKKWIDMRLSGYGYHSITH